MTGNPEPPHGGAVHFDYFDADFSPETEPNEIVDLCVIGLGYVGLPTAAVFAAAGLRVAGVDIDADRVDRINAGCSELAEPGLDRMLRRAVQTGRLIARDHPVRARTSIIAVPTPLQADKTPDLRAVHAAGDALAPLLEPGSTVILESTVPVGATRQLAERMAKARPDLSFPGSGPADVCVAHCPERVLPGRVLTELRNNDRVIGGLDTASAEAAADLFRRILAGDCLLTDAETAEMTKLAENAFRDINIAFANELETIADTQGIDARTVIALANRHPRVDILEPGPGVGGHCIAIDPWFLAASGHGRSRLIPMARMVNDARPAQIAARAAELVEDLDRPVIACFGLTYKRDVKDLRESPALTVVGHLARQNLGPVLVVDPNVETLPSITECVHFVSAAEAIARADLAVLLVDHTEFTGLEATFPDDMRRLDTRGLWSPAPRCAAGGLARSARPGRAGTATIGAIGLAAGARQGTLATTASAKQSGAAESD